MKRLALTLLIVLPFLCFASTPQEILTKRYKDFNVYLVKGNTKGMGNWLRANCGAKLTYTSFHKSKFDRNGYINGVFAQMAQTNKVLSSTTTVRELKKTGNTIVATVASDFKGVVIMDTRKMILMDQSVTYETWSQVGKDWKLTKIEQVNQDMQMHGDGN